jgi:hypothetical protein
VCPSDFFVKLFRKHVHTKWELLRSRPEGNLSQYLVGKGARHNKRRVTSSTAIFPVSNTDRQSLWPIYAPEVDETTFCKENDVSTRGHCKAVNLRLNVNRLLGICFQPGDVDLNIEMADTTRWVLRTVQSDHTKDSLADNSIFGHCFKVLSGNDVPVSSSSHEDIGARCGVFHSRNFIASHRCLKRIDGVNFRN